MICFSTTKGKARYRTPSERLHNVLNEMSIVYDIQIDKAAMEMIYWIMEADLTSSSREELTPKVAESLCKKYDYYNPEAWREE